MYRDPLARCSTDVMPQLNIKGRLSIADKIVIAIVGYWHEAVTGCPMYPTTVSIRLANERTGRGERVLLICCADGGARPGGCGSSYGIGRGKSANKRWHPVARDLRSLGSGPRDVRSGPSTTVRRSRRGWTSMRCPPPARAAASEQGAIDLDSDRRDALTGYSGAMLGDRLRRRPHVPVRYAPKWPKLSRTATL
jgi:hypothetical protein